MKIIPLILLAASFAVAVKAQVAAGMSEAELLRLKGPPVSRVTSGEKSVLGWRDVAVTVVRGTVESVRTVEPQRPRRVQLQQLRAAAPPATVRRVPARLPAAPKAETEEQRLKRELARKHRIEGLEFSLRILETNMARYLRQSEIAQRGKGLVHREQYELWRIEADKVRAELSRLKSGGS